MLAGGGEEVCIVHVVDVFFRPAPPFAGCPKASAQLNAAIGSAMPTVGNDALPPLPPVDSDDTSDGSADPAGDGLGDSTAPAPGSRRKASASKADETVPA